MCSEQPEVRSHGRLPAKIAQCFEDRQSFLEVPAIAGSTGGATTPCNVTTSGNPAFGARDVVISLWRDEIATSMPRRSNTASASFNPMPNCPITAGWPSFSAFSFWVRCS